MRVNLPHKPGRTASIAALLDTDQRTRLLAWAITALRERRIQRPQSSAFTRCAADFTQLANLQLEYAKAVGEKRAVYTGPLPSLAGVLRLLAQSLVDEALRECERVRAELAPILWEARRRLQAARQ